ncbi:MAG: transglutaminase-like domain-containing protein [Vicinamibacteria bacterium]
MNLRLGRLAAVAIVVCWAAILGTHLWRSWSPAAVASATMLDSVSPLEAAVTQRGVFYRGSRIGFVRERFLPLEHGARTEQEGRFRLNILGQERELEIAGTATVGTGGELETFSFRLTTVSGRSPFETVIDGRVEGNELVLNIASGGGTRTERRRLDEPVVIPLNLHRSLAVKGMKPGQVYRVRLFDPMTLTEGEAEIKVMEPEIVHWSGREDEAFRIQSRFAGLVTTAWIDAEGELLKEETPLGWTLLKEAPGSGLQAQGTAEAPDVLAATAIPAIGFAGDAARLRSVRLKLNKFPLTWQGLEGGRQRLNGDELVIEVERLPPPPSGPLSDAELEQALAADGFVQSDDPTIMAQAARLTAGLTPPEAARAITDWVYENVRKTPTLSVPSAREVLEQMTGDCNEHTVLFTALARAAQIPTRICTGLAFSAGQFYYHAWPEVWLGSWVALDPTFGQYPADPLHVRLLTGGLEQQFEILNLMGRRATIEILETE